MSRWLTLGANVGVLIGLILLIIELNQNTLLARLQLEDSRRSAFLQGEFAIYGDRVSHVWAKSILNPADLSASDIRVLDAYLVNTINRSASVYDLEAAGLLESGSTMDHLRSNLAFDFGNHYAQRWWKYERELWTGEFGKMVDAVIGKLDPTSNKERIQNLQADAARFASAATDE